MLLVGPLESIVDVGIAVVAQVMILTTSKNLISPVAMVSLSLEVTYKDRITR